MTNRITPPMRRVHEEIAARGAGGAAIINWHGSTVHALIRAGLVEYVPRSRQKFVRIKADLPGPACRWFARCPNPATTAVAHPILGDVPTCQRHERFATDGGGAR